MPGASYSSSEVLVFEGNLAQIDRWAGSLDVSRESTGCCTSTTQPSIALVSAVRGIGIRMTLTSKWPILWKNSLFTCEGQFLLEGLPFRSIPRLLERVFASFLAKISYAYLAGTHNGHVLNKTG